MTVLITLTVAGTDSGPFNLFSNVDGFTSAFETGVSKASLLAGYSSALVPDYTTVIRVLSTGDCTNYIDITLDAPVTTTTSTTTAAPTTSTTTTLICFEYLLAGPGVSGEENTAEYLNCFGGLEIATAYDYQNVYFCANSIVTGSVSLQGPCTS